MPNDATGLIVDSPPQLVMPTVIHSWEKVDFNKKLTVFNSSEKERREYKEVILNVLEEKRLYYLERGKILKEDD